MPITTRIIAVLFFLAISLPSNALSLCDADYLNACVDLNRSDCLQKYQACGQYEAIINHFASEQMVNPLTAYYYQGVAYYGLFLRHRARSLKCEYVSAARSNLRGYLGEMEKRFNKQGNFGTESPDQIYHATKLYDRLLKVSGCLESGLSEREIRYRTRTYIIQALEGLFFQTSDVGALADNLKAVKKAIHTAINGFISKAAAIETQLALRRIELKASQRRIRTIINLYEGEENGYGFGQANAVEKAGKITQVAPKFTEKAALKSARMSVDEKKKAVAVQKNALDKALGEQNIEDYEKARDAIVKKAQATITKAVQLSSMSQHIVSSEGSQFSKILETTEEKTSEAKKIHERIRQSWREYGEQRYYCTTPETSKAWFCSE
jgi:hypothetical protein